MRKYQLYILSLIAVFCLFPIHLNGQVPTYRGIKRIGNDVYNIPPAKSLYRYKSSKELHVVYSDRSFNRAYNTAFGQRTLQEVSIGEAFYIIGEKNDYFQVVKADHKYLGHPKALFGFMFCSDNHFKDAANTPVVGWIPKSNLLLYNHSFASEHNHLPIRYRAGITTLDRLFDLHRYIVGDSITVFKEPYLKSADTVKIAMGQIVYAYKYDKAKRVVLISDKPKLSDSERKVLGWIPSDLILEAGQYHIYKTDMSTTLDSVITFSNDTLNVRPMDLQSGLFFVNQNKTNALRISDSSKANYKVIDLPVSVWDRTRNKLINVKGGDIMVSDISKMLIGQKTTNFHLFIFSNERNDIKRLVSSFQNLALKFQPGHKQNFSATIISERGNIYFDPTENFAKWLDCLTSLPAVGRNKNDSGFSDAIRHLIRKVSPDKFEDNILIVLGSNQSLSLTQNLHSELARRSFSISFLQLFGEPGEGGQDYLLKAKDIIDDNISSYNDYITNYIVDSKLLKPSLFSDYGEEDKIYLLDAPNSSLATGGIVFPASNEKLSTATVGLVLDTLLFQIKQRDELLLNNLIKYEKRLGVIRSRPSHILYDLHKSTNDTLRNIDDIDRNSVSDTYLLHGVVSDSVLSKLSEGYLFTVEETKNVIQNFRDLLPTFSDSIGKKEFCMLRKILHKQRNLLNEQYLCRILDRKSTLSDLFYYKTSVQVNDSILYRLRISHLKIELYKSVDWNWHYKNYLDKINTLEDRFVKDQLEKISISGVDYYYIPKNDLP